MLDGLILAGRVVGQKELTFPWEMSHSLIARPIPPPPPVTRAHLKSSVFGAIMITLEVRFY